MATTQNKNKKEGFFTKLKTNDIFKSQVLLTFSMVWALLNAIYNFFIAYYDSDSRLSWFWGLVIWFGISFVIKLILLIASKRMVKGKDHIMFKKIAITYLFINVCQIALITLTPRFVGTVFASKFKGITIANLITNIVSCLIFFSSFKPVNKDKFSLEEFAFLKAKQYIGRSEGLFTIIILIFNIVMILVSFKAITVDNEIIGNIYVGIGLTFVVGNLVAAIWLCKTKKYVTRK